MGNIKKNFCAFKYRQAQNEVGGEPGPLCGAEPATGASALCQFSEPAQAYGIRHS